MNHAGNIEIIRKHSLMITKKICILLCLQSCNHKTPFLTKVIFIQGALKNIQGLLWKIQGLFDDIPQFFNFQGLFKACVNHVIILKLRH